MPVDYSVYAYRGNYTSQIFKPLENVKVKPRNIQPDPTQVELKDCVGVLQIILAQDESCKPSANVSPSTINSLRSYTTPDGYITAYIRSGSDQTTSKAILYYYIKTAIGWVEAEEPLEWSGLQCDQIIRQCKVVHEPTIAVGDINGPFDVLGESLVNYRSVNVSFGPGGGSVYDVGDKIKGPIDDPSKWWRIHDLLEGNYLLFSHSFLRRGRDFTAFDTPVWTSSSLPSGVDVEAGKNLTLSRVIDGENRYPFVMKPSFFYGSVHLADPFVPHNPGSTSTLQNLYFAADYDSNGDGIPNKSDYYYYPDNSTLSASAPNWGRSITSFPGKFLPATGELTSTYEQVLPGTYDLPYTWSQNGLNLTFWSGGEDITTRPGLYDPDLLRYGSLTLSPNANTYATLSPGDRYRIDHAYCFNEVKLLYRTELGRFVNPQVSINGGYSGLDWRQQPVDYSVSGDFYGDPFVWGGYPVTASDPKTQGHLYMTLPQGTFTLSPKATLVSDSGAQNSASFSPVRLTTGCGQRLNIVPPLVVLIDPPNRCATSKTTHVTGQVTSSPATVDRLSYRVNDGPSIELCRNCGTDPTFSFNASLQTCENTLKVFAENGSLPEPATGSQQVVWDDPANGPSCPGTYCLNQPPVARCRNLVVPAGSSCSQGCGSVNDGSYDPDPSDTVTCTQSPNCPYSLGANAVTLTCKDSAGNTSSCDATVTVRDMDPPTITCPSVPVLTCTDGGAQVTLSPTAQDACGAVTTSCTPSSGSTLPVGTTTATCTAVDASGNRASCSVAVTVSTDGPAQLTCPEPFVRECVLGALITPPAASAGGSCMPLSIQSPPASSFPLGTTPLTYTATDSAGVVSSCTTSITVRDTLPPTLTLSGASAITLVQSASPFSEPGFSASDACSGDLSSQVHVSGTVNPGLPGHYLLTYSVQDAAGLTASATRTVDVVASSQGPGQGTGQGPVCGSPLGSFTPTPTGTSSLHLQHTATPLGQGRVLVVGGFIPSAELYDEATNTWVSTGSPLSTHRLHSSTLLTDGRVLVAGGEGTDPSASAEVYEPLTGTWSSTGALLTLRHEHSAVRLVDGRVLVMGGTSATGTHLASAELYDPSTGLWSSAGSMAHARRSFSATRLQDGRVLVAGGLIDDGDECLGTNCLSSAELFNPSLGTWSSTGSMTQSRGFHAAMRLADGRVLVSGGVLDGPSSAHAELYDPASGTWTATGDMVSPRRRHSLTLLPNGQLLAAGGYDAWTGILSSAELYTPSTGTWCATVPMGQNRYEHTATLLTTGQVLITAGFSTSSQYTAERYTP